MAQEIEKQMNDFREFLLTRRLKKIYEKGN